MLTFLLLLFFRTAIAEPFLVITQIPRQNFKAAKFIITINGKTSESVPFKNSEEPYIRYDLGGLEDGVYTAVIKAVDAQGTESVPFTLPFKKTGLRVETSDLPDQKPGIPPSRTYQGHLRSGQDVPGKEPIQKKRPGVSDPVFF
ncbi:MAG TPA: hypothetical protein VHO84_02950 [Syntrophorhabdaceae bacterium]|nr:hypothetical protein [Syntrophorhabdaceae bacterium]